MRLTWRFFLSYLLVAAVSLGVLALSMALFTPASFSDYFLRHMPMTVGNGNGNWNGFGGGSGMMGTGGMMSQSSAAFAELDNDLDAQFDHAVNDALLRAALAATLAAALTSWVVSRSILAPIRRMSDASNIIAEGHYDQRLTYHQRDELGDLISSFNRMAAALAETEAIRQQLIADVSHELKTPLSSIKGYMEGLQDGIIPATPATFQLIHDEAARLQRLAHDLQELSRAEAHFELDTTPHSVESIVSTATARLRPQFADKGVTLTAPTLDDLPLVRVDQDRIGQVMINLLGNALQYTPSGGQVTIHAQPTGATLQLTIHDTGVGLAEDDLTRIFQRFYRVDKSRARASGGSGIGLTIARRIVEAHGGTLWAESPGLSQGSSFHFTLPLV